MADIEMNAFKMVADAAYIYGEAADGSQLKIKKSELLNALFQDRADCDDANKAVNIGSYRITNNQVANIPYSGYGLLLTFCAGTYILQIYLSGSGISQRKSPDKGKIWSDWKSITLT